MRKQEIDHILTRMLDSNTNVSDLNLTVGKPYQVESAGQLVPVDIKPRIRELTPFQTETFALNLINRDRRLTEALINQGSCDLSYSLPGKARFRVNIFSQQGHYSLVLRQLESKVPTIKEMKLPEAFYNVAKELNGIVFVTGATGSGKSTSLAAMLEDINENKSVHVVTLEDPIEYQHPHKKSTFNQRELGTDFDTFANGLRAALRQAPKVILVGEMRDRETVEIGLNAAETGHLVLTTLHTVDAVHEHVRRRIVRRHRRGIRRILVVVPTSWVELDVEPRQCPTRIVRLLGNEVFGLQVRLHSVVLAAIARGGEHGAEYGEARKASRAVAY